MSERRKSVTRFTRSLLLFWAVFFVVSGLVYSVSIEYAAAHTLGTAFAPAANGNCGTTEAATPANLSFTTTAGDSIVVLAINVMTATLRAGGAPTYGGITMTQANSTQKPAAEVSAELWYLLSPPIGANSFSIPNTNSQALNISGASFKAGSNQATALDVANGSANTTANPTASITTNVNGAVIAVSVSSGATAWAPTNRSGLTVICGPIDSGAFGFESDYLLQANAGAFPPSGNIFTQAADDWGLIVAGFKPVIGTTLGNGTNPGNSTIAPGAAITPINDTILTTSSGTDAITEISVNLSSNVGVGTLSISSASNCASGILGSIGGGTGSGIVNGTNSISISSTNATTGGTHFYTCITPLSHTDMPAVPGASNAATAVVNGWTGTNPKVNAVGLDTSATITIDNASPGNATSVSGTAGNAKVTLNWTTPAGEPASSINSIVLQWNASSAGSDVPTEGSDPAVNAAVGSATVACRFTSQSSSVANSAIVVGTGNHASCSSTALTNDGTPYSYKVFSRDAQGNYDAGVAINNLAPSQYADCFATATGTWDGAGGGTATWSGCTGTSGRPGATDRLTVNSAVTLTISGNATVRKLTLAAVTGTAANGVTINTGVTVNITTDVVFGVNSSSNNQTVTLNGTAILNVGGNLDMSAVPTAAGDPVFVGQAASSSCQLNVTGSTTMTNASTAVAGAASINLGNCSSGTFSTGSLSITGNATGTATTTVSTATGTITVNGATTFTGNAGDTLLTVTGAGTLNLHGNLGSGGTVTLAATSLTDFKASGTIGGAYTFGKLTISAGTLTLGANIVVASDWTNNSGASALSPSTNTVTIGVPGAAGATINIGGSALTSFYALTFGNAITSTQTINLNQDITVSNNWVWTASALGRNFVQSSGDDITVTGTLTMNNPSAAVTDNWQINDGTATVDGLITLGATTASSVSRITITSGTLSANGGITAANTTAANHVIDMSGGSGRLNLKGAWATTGGTGAAGFTFTAPNCTTNLPTLNYADTSSQTVYVNYTGSLCNLQISNTAGATLNAAISSTNVLGDVIVGGSFATDRKNYGSQGSGTDNFSIANPAGVAFDPGSNKIIVSDRANHRIARFDSGTGGTTLGANRQNYGTSGSGTDNFNFPIGVTVDTTNNKIFVTDSLNHRIARFDSGGGGTTFGANVQYYGSSGSGTDNFSSPNAVALDIAANKVYVADTGNHRIARFDSGGGGTTFGANVQYYGSSGSGTDNFSSPNAVALDIAANKVYVHDDSNNRIARFDSGTGGTTFGQNRENFSYTYDTNIRLALDATNNKLYVSEDTNNRIARFDSGGGGTTFGQNRQIYGGGSSSSSPNSFYSPSAIAVDTSNNLVAVLERNNYRVSTFGNTGTVVSGILNGNALAIAGNASKGFIVQDGSSYIMTGTGNLLPTTFSLSFAHNSTVEYRQTTSTTITSGVVFGNVLFMPDSGATVNFSTTDFTTKGNVTIDGANVSSDTNLLCITASATLTINGNFIINNKAHYATASSTIALVVNGNLTINNGGSLNRVSSSGNTVTLAGNLVINSGGTVSYNATVGTFTFNAGTSQTITDNNSTKENLGPVVVAVNGSNNTSLSSTTAVKMASLTVNTNQTYTGSQDLTVGDILGGGVVNTTGGTVTATGTLFGTNGVSNWVFHNLQFGDGSTIGTTSCASANSCNGRTITINGNLTIATNWTLNASRVTSSAGRTFILNGAGSNVIINGNLNTHLSKFTFKSSTNINIPAISYYDLSFEPASGSPTYTIGTAVSQILNVSGTMTVGDGSNAVTVTAATYNPTINLYKLVISASGTFTSTSGNLNVVGDLTNNNVFNANSGTVEFKDVRYAYAATDTGSLSVGLGSPDGTLWVLGTMGTSNSYSRDVVRIKRGSTFGAVLSQHGSRIPGNSGTGLSWTHNYGATATTPCNGSAPQNDISDAAYSSSLGIYIYLCKNSTTNILKHNGSATLESKTAPAANNWTSIDWSSSLGTFAAVSSQGNAMYSSDGNTWSSATVPEANPWQSVVWSPSLGMFVAVATSGTNRVMTSTNGTSWSTASAAEQNSWYSVDWSEPLGLFVAISSDGTNRVMKSSNGTSWSPVSVSNDLGNVMWAPEGKFITYNESANQTYTSVDGDNWSSAVSTSLPSVPPVSVAGSAMVIFNNTHSLTGSFTFNNLKAVTGGQTIKFQASQTYTVNGALSITGTSEAKVIITSSDGSTQFLINHQGTESIAYVDLRNAGCSSAPASTVITMDANSLNTANNNVTCWVFPAAGVVVQGTLYSDEGSTALTGTALTIRVAKNGTLAQSVALNTGNGTFNLPAIGSVSVGDVLTVFVDDDTNYATTVTKSNITTGTLSNIHLYKNRLIVRYETGTSITNADTQLGYYDADQDAQIKFTSNSNNLNLTAGKLIVWTGKVYRPGGTVTTAASSSAAALTGDVLIQASGELDMEANALSVGGDFVNAGTLTNSTGQTTTFTGTDGAGSGFTITSGGSNFDVLTFNGSGGKWTPSDTTNVDGNLTLTAGTVSGASNIALNVTGTTSLANSTSLTQGSADYIFTGNVTVGGGSSGSYTAGAGVTNLIGNLSLAAGSTWTKGAGNVVFKKGNTGQTWTDSTASKQDLGAVQIQSNTGNTSASLSSSVKATSINVNASQTLTLGANTLELTGTGTPITRGASATLDTASSTVKYSGTSANVFNAPSFTYNSLTLGGTGTYTIPGADLTLRGDLTVNTGSSIVRPFINKTGNTTDTSNQITNLGSTSDIFSGMAVSGSGIPSGAIVNNIVNGTTINISGNATATATGVSLNFSARLFFAKGGTANLTSVQTADLGEVWVAPNGATPTTLNMNSNSTMTKLVLANAAQTFAIPGANILELTGKGIPLQLNGGTFTAASGSTVNYTYNASTGNSATDCMTGSSGGTTYNAAVCLAPVTYHHLGVGTKPHGANPGTTFALGGNTTINGTLTVGSAVANVITRNGDVTSGSNTISGLAATSDLFPGMTVFAPSGYGIGVGTKIGSIVNGTSITVVSSAGAAQNANSSASGLSFKFGGNSIVRSGTTSTSSNNITGLTATGDLQIGMSVSGPGVPVNAHITSINSSSDITISANATASATVTLTFAGNSASRTATLTASSANVTLTNGTTNDVFNGMYVSGNGIPANTTVQSITNTTQFVMSANATASGTFPLIFSRPDILTTYCAPINISGRTGTYSSASNSIVVNNAANLLIGMFVFGSGIPSGATIVDINDTTLTISSNTTGSGTNAALNFNNCNSTSSSSFTITVGNLRVTSGGRIYGNGSTINVQGNDYTNSGSAVCAVSYTNCPAMYFDSEAGSTMNTQNTNIVFKGCNMTIPATTYYQMNMEPPTSGSCGATPNYKFDAGTFAGSNAFSFGSGVNPVTVDAATNNPDFTISGSLAIPANVTFQKGTGSFTFNGGTTQTLTDSTSNGGQDLGTVTVTNNSTLQLGSTAKVSKITVGGGSGLNLGGTNDFYITGTGTGVNRPLQITGNFTPSTGTVKYVGVGATTIEATTYHGLKLVPGGDPTYTVGNSSRDLVVVGGDLELGDGVNALTVDAVTNDPDIEVAGDVTINGEVTWQKGSVGKLKFNKGGTAHWYDNSGGQDVGHVQVSANGVNPTTVILDSDVTASDITVDVGQTLNITNRTVKIKGNGSGLIANSGTLTTTGSTIEFASAGTSGTTVPAGTYHNLKLNKASNAFTLANNTTINNNLDVTAGTFDMSNKTVEVLGTTTIDDTLTGSSGTLTINGDFVNNGTFNHNNGTVAIKHLNNSNTVNIKGSANSTFYDLAVTDTSNFNKKVAVKASSQMNVTHGLTLTGSLGLGNVILDSDTGSPWTVNVDPSATVNINYAVIRNASCAAESKIMNTNETVTNGGNNGACWTFINRGIIIPGGSESGGGTPGGGGGGQGGSGGGEGSGGGGGVLPQAFTGNAITLTAYDSNWTNLNGSFNLTSNTVIANEANALARWMGGTFNDNQYAQVTVSSLNAGKIGVAVRTQNGANSGYYAYTSGGGTEIVEVNGGSTFSHYSGAAFSAGDVLRLEVVGTSLTLKRNGNTVTTVTDGTFTSGRPGLYGSSGASNTTGDDWYAESIASQGGGGGGGGEP